MAKTETGQRLISKFLEKGDTLQFRSLKVEDIPALVEIERLSFKTPWSDEAFYHELKHNAFAHYIVAVQRERVIAYCGMWLIVDEAHITNIAVHPQFRGAKVGEQLLASVMAYAQLNGADKMTLEVRPSNEAALNLYKKFGFVHTGTRPEYYPDNLEDAWIMWVKLDDINDTRS